MLVVDVQTALVENHPFNELNVIKNIRELIEATRRENIEIVYIRHDGGISDEREKNTRGWELYQDITPKPSDKIFDKKFNSAFKGTGLQEYLDSKNITTIILVSMQTKYCIDTTCKTAFEYGYNLIIPQNTTTTYDNDLLSGESLVRYYEQKI